MLVSFEKVISRFPPVFRGVFYAEHRVLAYVRRN